MGLKQLKSVKLNDNFTIIPRERPIIKNNGPPRLQHHFKPRVRRRARVVAVIFEAYLGFKLQRSDITAFNLEDISV